jgi:predicted NUDIX family phosphoesterase
LHSFCSIGIGGHVKRQDVPLEVKSILEIFDLARVREAQEEFDFTWTGKPVLLGVLNDESNSVGKVHLGIVYEYWLASAIVRPREYRTPIDCGFVSIPELMPHSLEYETWSQIIIKDHLSSRD